MLNWIKYLPLDWRKRENDGIPRGPNFASARPVSIVIGGSRQPFQGDFLSCSSSLAAETWGVLGDDILAGGFFFGPRLFFVY